MNKNEILRYLGYQGRQPDQKTDQTIVQMMELTREISRPQWVYALLGVEKEKTGLHICSTNFLLRGESIAFHLQRSDMCALMAATLGFGFDQKMNELEYSDPGQALILDACGSAYIEEVCDNVEREIVEQADLPGHTGRFSPGYGDLPLSTQQIFQNILQMDKKAGINLTPDNMMTPRKSVTAIIGFSSQPYTGNFHSCQSCHLACALRKEQQ